MVHPVSLGALLIGAVSPLCGMLSRQFDPAAADLESRKQLCRELMDACTAWSTLLAQNFNQAIDFLASQGVAAARSELERQQTAFNALDYTALTEHSEALACLRTDPRFHYFAASCAHFYNEATRTKDLMCRTFMENGEAVSLEAGGIDRVGRIWKRRIEDVLLSVRAEYRKIDRLGEE